MFTSGDSSWIMVNSGQQESRRERTAPPSWNSVFCCALMKYFKVHSIHSKTPELTWSARGTAITPFPGLKPIQPFLSFQVLTSMSQNKATTTTTKTTTKKKRNQQEHWYRKTAVRSLHVNNLMSVYLSALASVLYLSVTLHNCRKKYGLCHLGGDWFISAPDPLICHLASIPSVRMFLALQGCS